MSKAIGIIVIPIGLTFFGYLLVSSIGFISSITLFKSCNEKYFPDPKILSVTTDYNVMKNGVNGISFNVKLSLYGLKDKDVSLWGFFGTNETYALTNSTLLLDRNHRYCTADGHVSVDSNIHVTTSMGDNTTISLFLPYSEFHIANPDWDVKFLFKLFYEGQSPNAITNSIQEATSQYYEIPRSLFARNSTLKNARWEVDYNTNNTPGINFYLDFDLNGRSGRTESISITFWDHSKNGRSYTKRKQVECLYQNSSFKNVSLFVPYSELIELCSTEESYKDIYCFLNFPQSSDNCHLDFSISKAQITAFFNTSINSSN